MAITIASITESGGNTIVQVNNNGTLVSDPAAASLTTSWTVTYGGVTLPVGAIGSPTTADITLTGTWSPAPTVGDELVFNNPNGGQNGGGGGSPSLVEKKFVGHNAQFDGGSFTDVRANTAVFTGAVAISGSLGMGGQKIENVAAGTEPTDGVNYGQLLSEISAAATDEESRIAALEGRASNLEGDVSDLSTALAQEIVDRAAGDSALSVSLSQEIVDREAADSALSVSLSQEIADRTAGDSELSVALSTELSVREAAVADLSSALAQEISDRETATASVLSVAESYADQKIADLVDSAPSLLDTLNELAAALGDDANFSVSVLNNIASAKSEISGLVSAEVVRAEGAEAELSSAIAQEIADREAAVSALSVAVSVADSTLQSNIDAEAADRSLADVSLSTAIVDEASARVAGDVSLSTLISTEVSDRISAVADLSSAVSTALSSEESVRILNDAELSGLIFAETSVRIIEDAALSSELSAEAFDRESADTSLSTLIFNEEQARIADVSSLSTALSSEVSDREAADTSLSTALSVAMFDMAADLADETSRALAAEASLAADISIVASDLADETSRALAAEGSIAADLSAEIDRAMLAEQTITNRFDAQLAGLSWKNSAKAMITDANPAFSGLYTVDGYSLVAGDRVLVNSNYLQSGDSNNGIWVVGTGSWDRSADADLSNSESLNELDNAALFVEFGTTFADTAWVQVNHVAAFGQNAPIKFVQFAGMGLIVAGAGLTKSGNTLDVGSDSTITVGADEIRVSDSYTSARDGYADGIVAELSSAVSAALSSEESVRIAGDSQLSAQLSSAELSLNTRASTIETDLSSEIVRATNAEDALDSRLDYVEGNYLDKSVGGTVVGPVTVEDSVLLVAVGNDYAIAVDPSGLTLNVSTTLENGSDLTINGGSFELKNANGGPVLAADDQAFTVYAPATVNNQLTVSAGGFTVSDGQNNLLVVDPYQSPGVMAVGVMVSASKGLEVDTFNGGVLRVANTNTNENYFEVGSAQVGVNVPMTVLESLKIGADLIELAPVVAKLTTTGSGHNVTTGAMWSDFANFNGIAIATFQVVAMDSDGVGKGRADEYRVSARCNSGTITVESAVTIESELFGNISGFDLDVEIYSDGTIKVLNGPTYNTQTRWHVQRVKVCAVDTAGNVK